MPQGHWVRGGAESTGLAVSCLPSRTDSPFYSHPHASILCLLSGSEMGKHLHWFRRVWFIRTPCSLPSPFSSSSPLGLGGFVVFVFKRACVSWDWVTLIYYALDSLTKDCGTGHLFSECWFPVLLQPSSAGAEWNTDVFATLSPWEKDWSKEGRKRLFLKSFSLQFNDFLQSPFL